MNVNWLQQHTQAALRLKWAQVPQRTLDILAELREIPWQEMARAFATADRRQCCWFLLAGPTGVGKSTAAALSMGIWADNHEWNQGPSGGNQRPQCLWVPATEFAGAIQYGTVDEQWLGWVRKTHFLVLDDLGEEIQGPAMVALRDVLFSRHENYRRTVMTTNLKPQLFRERYGEALVDRINKCGMIPNLLQEGNVR